MSDERVEIVARAFFESRGYLERGGGRSTWETVGDATRRAYLNGARAALDALPDPPAAPPRMVFTLGYTAGELVEEGERALEEGKPYGFQNWCIANGYALLKALAARPAPEEVEST